jgi:putative ABC transport system permease protein
MNVWQSVRMALNSLSSSKMRSGLTMLGIIIGTGAVVALLSVGQGAQRAITDQIQSIGSNLIFVFAGQLEPGQVRVRSRPLTRQDAEALGDASLLPHLAAVAPAVERNAQVTLEGETTSVSLIGATPDYAEVRSLVVEHGAFFGSEDEATAARVVVVGSEVAESLVGDGASALGLTVRINGVPFEITGVLEQVGGMGMMGGSRDAIAIVPLSTAQRRLFGSRAVSTAGTTVDVIFASAVDEASIPTAMDEISWALRDRHDLDYDAADDFSLTSQEDILGIFDQITNVLTIFLGAIAGISLLVGGIGIMNIMLVSVTERTREIGLRKAVGARRVDVLAQFLVESVVLSVLGGLIGIAFGWAVSAGVNTLDAFMTYVSASSVALAFGFSLAVGLFFGIYPASRAANLNPIDALRYE